MLLKRTAAAALGWKDGGLQLQEMVDARGGIGSLLLSWSRPRTRWCHRKRAAGAMVVEEEEGGHSPYQFTYQERNNVFTRMEV